MRSPRTASLAVAMLVVVGVLAQAADAAPRRYKVQLETDPEGATVYLGDKEAGGAGQTPLELELTAGEHILILELDGHLPSFETIVVEPRKGKAAKTAQVFTFMLAPANATLVVPGGDDAGFPDGTRVLIDGEDQGEPPVRVEVAVGAHQVQILAPGMKPYEEWIEVEGGQEHVLAIGGERLEAKPPVVEDRAPPKPPAAPRGEAGPLGTLRAGVEIGWRRWRYDTPRTPNLRPFDASGTVLFAIEAELHPWRRFLRNKLLDRLSIVAGAGLAPTITASDDAGMTVEAFWRQQHAGARLRLDLHDGLAVDLDAGWAHLLYTFRDTDGMLVDEVPDVDYHMIRIGAQLRLHSGGFEAWAGVDNRLVVSGGLLEDRFRSAGVDGVGARVGTALRLLGRHLEARAEAALTRFGWEFEAETGDPYDAEGGTDLLFGITLSLGGTY